MKIQHCTEKRHVSIDCGEIQCQCSRFDWDEYSYQSFNWPCTWIKSLQVLSPARKEESNVAQHIQKYYPNLDTSPIELKTVTTVEPEPVVVKQEAPIVQQVQQVEQVQQVQQAQPAPVQQVQQAQQVQQPTPTQVIKVKEEAIPVPLKPIQTEVPTQPNDGVKVGIGGVAASVEQYNVSVNQEKLSTI